MRILLVEDEKDLREALRDTLAAAGYTVECCENGPDGLDALCCGGCELALLDRLLPGMDGLEVLRQARQAGCATPVLVLTALNGVGDRVEGLDAGADDYLAKPFAPEELLARVRALGRRPARWEPTALRRGDVELDVAGRVLTGPAGARTLSGRECALLELFLHNPGVTLPRERILLNVWGPDSEVESGNIDNYIHLVRRRLRLAGSRMELVTCRGTGYRLEEDPC